MSPRRFRVALISATPAAIGPATDGLAAEFPEADVWNLLDDKLMADASDAGDVTGPLADRMRTLIASAIDGGADGVLLTCSLYGPIARDTVAPIPVHAPDEAAFAAAGSGQYRRILIVASFESALTDAVRRFTDDATARGRNIDVRGVVAEGAMAAANAGDTPALVDSLERACREATAGSETSPPPDAALLAQYSLAPAARELHRRLGLPVISGPVSAAAALRARITTDRKTRVLGAIADDYTGGTDIALAFHAAGLRTVLIFTTPPAEGALPPHDAVVIALKTRTIQPAEAVSASLSAADWLDRAGADQIYFKYCSTFDSTADGNIGPVLDALARRHPDRTVVTTPSSPAHGRTVYAGRLFVDGVPLHETPMAHHPLTPMTDSWLPRVLAQQSARPVDSLPLPVVRRGPQAVREALADRRIRHLVADAVDAADLTTLARAVADEPLVAGAAGLGAAIAANRARTARTASAPRPDPSQDRGPDHDQDRGPDHDQDRGPDHDPVGAAPAAVLAGSSSARTRQQIDDFVRRGHPSHQIVLTPTSTPDSLAAAALDWVDAQPAGVVPLVYSSLPPDELARVQRELGVAAAARLAEEAVAVIARGLVDRGVRRLVLAGGETSGAVVAGLGVTGGSIGAEVAPGVPWIFTLGDPRLAILLKSGNFGDVALFDRATDPAQQWGTSHDDDRASAPAEGGNLGPDAHPAAGGSTTPAGGSTPDHSTQ